ncbi:MAG: ABC transporter substrate binding protein [Christensenellales bacterium]|jgi:putative ABC transport system substrate-binding protein
MKTKNIVVFLLIFIMSFTILTGCASNGEQKMRVAIVQPMSHTSLDQIRDTIVAELGDEYDITLLNTNGDNSALATVFQNVKSQNIDIVIPIATSAAQSAKTVFEGSNTPIVFSAVSDPVSAGLTGDDAKNITGISNNIPADEIVKLISNFQPDYSKIGFLYTSSEVNSVSTINAAKAYCDENGIAYEEASIAELRDLPTAVNTLISKGVDALYTGNDNAIASAMLVYTDLAYGKKIPVYCGADSMVSDGGFATIGIDYVELGKQTAELVKKIAGGEKPFDLPYTVLTEYVRFVNLQAANRLGLSLSESMLEEYEILVEKDGTSHFGK